MIAKSDIWAIWIVGVLLAVALPVFAYTRGWLRRPSKKFVLWTLAIICLSWVLFKLYSLDWKWPDWHFPSWKLPSWSNPLWLQKISIPPSVFWISSAVGVIILLIILAKAGKGFYTFTAGAIACGAVGLGIYWGYQKINQGIPEKLEFSGYYHYEEDGENGGLVLVSVTPDNINFGFPSKRLGGNVSMRWSRRGGGVWTRVYSGGKSEGSTLQIINVTGEKEKDFQEWKHLITGEIGRVSSAPGVCRISLTR